MANAILLPSCPYPAPFTGHKLPSTKSTFPATFRIWRKPNPRFSSSSATFTAASSSTLWEQEEQRWLREEQRWLREEQRWLREELRWSSEREALLREISFLRLRVEALEVDHTPLAPAVKPVLMAGKERLLLSKPEPSRAEEDEAKEVARRGTKIPEENIGMDTIKEKTVRRTLRMGSEGGDVREMQEALLRLGFFSGDDDMEYSSFSSGTDRAIKTWQASLGVTENGIMTTELLEKLFVEQSFGDSSLNKNAYHSENSISVERNVGGTNGASVKETDGTEIQISQPRVFLLGENRWEEPSSLWSDKMTEFATPPCGSRCHTCRGEGRLMCTECDGSGQPNVETQFLEWVGEETNCPYCDGVGQVVCEDCQGKSFVQK